MRVTTWGLEAVGGVPSRRRPTGIRGRSPRAQRQFYSLFSKTYAFLGIFWPKFLVKNSFFKCLNKVCWCASKACVPRCMSPFLCLWAWSFWNFKTYTANGVGRKFSRGVMGKTRPKNSTIKLPSTVSVLCIKIQRGHIPPAPRCRRPCILQRMRAVGWLPFKI